MSINENQRPFLAPTILTIGFAIFYLFLLFEVHSGPFSLDMRLRDVDWLSNWRSWITSAGVGLSWFSAWSDDSDKRALISVAPLLGAFFSGWLVFKYLTEMDDEIRGSLSVGFGIWGMLGGCTLCFLLSVFTNAFDSMD